MKQSKCKAKAASSQASNLESKSQGRNESKRSRNPQRKSRTDVSKKVPSDINAEVSQTNSKTDNNDPYIKINKNSPSSESINSHNDLMNSYVTNFVYER